MEQRQVLPYMTPEEAETYRRYYGTSNIPTTSVTPIQPPDPTHYGGQHLVPTVGGVPDGQFNQQFNQKVNQPPVTQIPPSTNVQPNSMQYPTINQAHRRPSYPPAQTSYLQTVSHQRYGEEHTEVLGGNQQHLSKHNSLGSQGYTSTPNLDSLPGRKYKLEDLHLPQNVTISTGGEEDPTPIKPIPNQPERNYTYWEKLTKTTRFASRGNKPSSTRIILRSLQLIPAVIVIILAYVAQSSLPSEFDNVGVTTINYLYFPAALDILFVIIHSADYYQRRFSYRAKWPRMVPLIMDSLMFILFLSGLLALAFQYEPCPIGGSGGWCDRRNSLLAFATLSCTLSLLHIVWDLIGTCLSVKKVTHDNP